jgi:hypothetical protein
MNSSSKLTPANQYKVLLFFMLAWMVVNLLQAGFTGMNGDEAYYWMFSRRLEWGYFDHPPMVALSIKIGELIGHGNIFTRLCTVLLSCGTIFFGYKALPDNFKDVKTYIIAFSSIVVFHVYGFIVTPDSSLFFFTALFFYAYRLYLKQDRLEHVIFLAFSIIGLIYSKYHGVLPVFFVLLSNPKLLTKRSAWLVLITVIIGFLPHLWWQYRHDWPSFRYHLFERIGSRYKLDKTTNYIIGQLLIWGPFTTIPALYFFLKRKWKDAYVRAHYFTFFGILVFFFFSSFRSKIEPHWTLAGGISFIVLLLHILHDVNSKFKKRFTVLMFLNIIIVIIARPLFMIPGTPLKNVKAFREEFYGRSFADSVYQYAAGTPVVFADSYTFPSLYKYYHPQEASLGYNTVNSRKNYFSLSPDEALLNNKKIYVASQSRMGENDIEVNNKYAVIYLHSLDSFKAVNGLKIFWKDNFKKGGAGEIFTTSVTLSNPSRITIETGNRLFVNYSFIKTKKEQYVSESKLRLPDNILLPGYRKEIKLPVLLPKTPGKYKMIYSIVQPPFNGTFASSFFNIEVK